MKGNGGYARVYRGIFGHPALRDVAEEAAFMWMVAKAAWQPARVKFRDKPIHLKRGQLAISQRELAGKLRWSLGTFQRFITRLTTESMIDTHVESGVTVVTICNYNDYQASKTEAESPRDTPRKPQPSHSRVTEQRKEEIKKRKTPPIVPLAGDERKSFLPKDWKPPAIPDLPPEAQKMARQWPSGIYEREAEAFACYFQTRNRMMVNWRKAFANWIHKANPVVMREAKTSEPSWKSYMAGVH